MTDTTQTRIAIRPDLDVSYEEIADFCRRHHIRWLALFGSVLRDDFTEKSDVDVLVKFEPDRRWVSASLLSRKSSRNLSGIGQSTC